jgi:glycosyltransferase involved in cell wall biosynthesis
MSAIERLSKLPKTGRPLRVALFSGNYNYTLDGANRTLNRLVTHLQARVGAQVRVYSPTARRPAFPPAGELISVPSVAIPFRPDYRLALGMPSIIRRDIEAFRPDLVHVSAPDLLGSAALRLARDLDVPVVATLHTLFDTYLDYYGLAGLRSIVQRRLQAFYGACDFVLAPTAAIADELRIYSAPARVRIWPRGVDPEFFNPGRRSDDWRRRHNFDSHRPVIVFIGRIVMEKGLAVFVESIRRLEAHDGPAQVLVIGDGPARSWLEQQLPGAVFTGLLSGELLATALASGDILLNPSSTETFGNVNLEAMASGLAIVCADAANTRALLRHGVSAMLCSPSDPGAFCEAVSALINNTMLRGQLGREAHTLSCAYRWPEILNRAVDVYDEALSVRRAQFDWDCNMSSIPAQTPPSELTS